jgi:CRP-like cAMP-binding protein
MLTILEKADLLHEAELFCHVRTRSLARIAAIAEELGCEPRQKLFSEHENPDVLFVILEGEIAVSRNGSAERSLKRFQCAGAMAVLGNHPQAETAVTSTPTRVLRIDQESLFDAMAEDFNITRGILQALVRMAGPSRTPETNAKTGK